MSDAQSGEYEENDLNAILQWQVVASTAILCAALLIPFGALPVFDTGYYGLVAGSIQWLNFCAGLGATLLLVGLLIAPRATWSSAFNPASLALVAFAVFSAIPMIYADHASLILFGSPQSGKGVFWFLDAAVFIALAWTIRGSKPALIIVFVAALATTATVAGLRLYTDRSESELLLRGGDSYAYLGLLLPFLTLLIEPGRKRRYATVAAWPTAIACVAVSGNNAAIVAFLVLAIVFGLSCLKPALTEWLAKLRFPLVFVLTTGAALLISFLVISVNFRGTFDSLDSRLLIAKIVAAAQTEASPLQWAFGHGWGHTQGAFYRHLTESGADLLDNRWDFLWRDIFHSHNIVLELLYETGIAGFAAFCALLAALIAFSPPTKRVAASLFVAGYLVINSVWFEFAHTVPMLTLAIFSLAHDRSFGVPKSSMHRGLALAMVSVAALGCIAASVALNQFDSRVKPFKMDKRILVRSDYPTQYFPVDPRGDDFIRAATYREVVRQITTGPQSHTGSIAPAKAVATILDDIEARLPKTTDPELILVGLVIFNDAYFRQDRPWLKPVVAGREKLWDRLAMRHLALAPKRSDALVVYLSWLVTNERRAQATKLIDRILHTDRNDPVGLYFRGVIDANDPSPKAKERGLRYIAEAVDHGVERFLLVPQWLKKMAVDARTR